MESRLLDPKQPHDPIERFGYELAHGDAKGDPRFFSSPPSLIVSDINTFKRDAAAIRQQLQKVYEAIAATLVLDLERVIRKQPRLA